ncbi:MAG: FAD-dependent oxidoreductase, partial [Chloroflexota bacterium]
MTYFETIVVGNGLIGSAAGRYLSELGQEIAIIGQAEPADVASHDGVFASHYDQRRLTHVTGKRADVWMQVKQRAMLQYRPLEQQSGISFYDPIGFIMTLPADLLAGADSPVKTAVDAHISHTYYPAGDQSWRNDFPNYDFPASHALLYEPDPAGAIDPRAMRQAQNLVAQANGATLIDALVTDVHMQQGKLHVSTQSGKVYTANKVLLATGAFTNNYNLLPRKLALIPKTEVIILGEVSEAD